jgi:hypothetical protein
MGLAQQIFTGRFLVGEKSYGNWVLILMSVIFSLAVIFKAHQTETMVLEMSDLKLELKALRAVYIDTSTELMQVKLESNIRGKVEGIGLYPSEQPPYKLEIKE